MQMIDVMKRLAELDSKNTNIVKEGADLAECGMMPMTGMEEMAGQSEPSHPANINITAGSGEELGNLLTTIMTLAGVHKVEPSHLGAEPPQSTMTDMPALTAEPDVLGGPSMRNMIDKLNPEPSGDDGDDGMSVDQGDVDNDGDHDMDDHDAEQDDDEKETDETINSRGNNPNNKRPFDANQFANQENKPGQGDRMDGNMPKATMEQVTKDLFQEYKRFING